MQRRDLIRFGAATIAAGLKPSLLAGAPATPAAAAGGQPGSGKPVQTEQWGIFELSLAGPADGNPYKDVSLTARFTMEHRSVQVTGFYDGDGRYRVRFMPDALGQWTFETQSSAPELAGHRGEFECVAAGFPGQSWTSRHGASVSFPARRWNPVLSLWHHHLCVPVCRR